MSQTAQGASIATLTLSQREEQLRLAIDAAEVGLWDVDVLTNTLYWPARVKAMFGISPAATATLDDFVACLHPQDAEHVLRAFADCQDPALRTVYDVEYRTIGKEDGLLRWVAAKGRGLFNDQGECVRAIGTVIDITAKKQSEATAERGRRRLELLNRIEHATRSPQCRGSHAGDDPASGRGPGSDPLRLRGCRTRQQPIHHPCGLVAQRAF